MQNYNVVPNIISGKDLDYLSDMFNWNYTGYKELYNTLENISDNEVKTMISRVSEVLYNTSLTLLIIVLTSLSDIFSNVLYSSL